MREFLRRRALDRDAVESVAHAGAWDMLLKCVPAASLGVTFAALLFTTYQFGETVKVQRETIQIQQRSLESTRSGKAADLFERYLDVAYSRPRVGRGPEADAFRFSRDNRALVLLNSVYSVTKGDDDWHEIVFWSLRRFVSLARERKVLCLSLSREFRALLEQHLAEPSPNICHDMSSEQ